MLLFSEAAAAFLLTLMSAAAALVACAKASKQTRRMIEREMIRDILILDEVCECTEIKI